MSGSRLWRNSDYRWWFFADTSSMLGASTRGLAISLVAFVLTDSTAWAGSLGTISMAVGLVLTLPGGVIVDHRSRIAIMRLKGTASAVLWAVTATLLMLDQLPFWMLAAAVVVQAILSGLFGGATDASLRSIVEPQDFPAARAVSEGRDSAVGLLSSTASGALYSISPSLPFAFSALGNVAAVLTAGKISREFVPLPAVRGSMLKDVASGFSWVWAHRELRQILAVATITNLGLLLATSATELFLISQGTTAVAIGVTSSASAATALLGAVLAGRIVNRVPTGLLIGVSLAALHDRGCRWGLNPPASSRLLAM